MPRYRLKHSAADASQSSRHEEIPWLERGKSYHGLALLAFWGERKVRLFRPDGEGSVEIPRAEVEKS